MSTNFIHFCVKISPVSLQAFAVLSSALQPLLDRVKTNRAHWIELSSNGGEKFDYHMEKDVAERNDKSSLSSQNVDDTEVTCEGDSSGAVSLSSETNSKYDNLENPVVGVPLNTNVLKDKFGQLSDIN